MPSLATLYAEDPHYSEVYKAAVSHRHKKYVIIKDVLYKINANSQSLICVPQKLVNPLITKVHLQLHHAGSSVLKATLQMTYYIRNLDSAIPKVLNICSCYRNNTKTHQAFENPDPPFAFTTRIRSHGMRGV